MELYIEIKDGQTKNHPAFKENLIQAFGVIPDNWEPFVRVERPIPNVYQIFDSLEPLYEKINGVWTDVWLIRNMTEEEKFKKQQDVVNSFNDREYASNWSSWTLDETTCELVPPIPCPEQTEGKIVLWCGAKNNWKEAPAYPIDGYRYKFDFFNWQWVQFIDQHPKPQEI